MAQATFSIRMDESLKRQFDALCADFGMTASTAFNIFAKAVVRERRIPFEIVAQEVSREGGEQAFMYAKKTARIGIAKNEFTVPDDIDKYNDEIYEMFGGNE